MGFFSDIKDKIFNRHREAAVAAPKEQVSQPSVAAPSPAPQSAPATTAQVSQAERGAQPAATTAPSPAAAPASASPDAAPVDVAAILDQAVKDSGQKLNWRTSIVDLMKALGIDSSLASRKELAKELNYSGDTEDSAAMNIWLHKQVLQKLAANGGKVPADLLD